MNIGVTEETFPKDRDYLGSVAIRNFMMEYLQYVVERWRWSHKILWSLWGENPYCDRTNPAVLPLAGWLLPCGAIGLAVGARLRNKIPTSGVLTLVWIVLIVAGVNLISRSVIGAFA
ncbi:hypothetical protein R69746_06333 [Paraburkholderia aspalathi]|nr:hypothetical protein R69746_06333 [Paraburkholderia aspalathi]CAE6832586.1 hypothetical protein R75465_06344 [Paraburkholderia aspalathi]